MQRRKFIAGLGSAAAAGAAGIGTGAFTSVSAKRDVTVDVAGDSSAFLQFEKAVEDGAITPNAAEYVTLDGEAFSVDLSSTDEGGSGVNKDAVSIFDNLVDVTNNGTQEINIGVDLSTEPDVLGIYAEDVNGEPNENDKGGGFAVRNYGSGDPNWDDTGTLAPGETLENIGVYVTDPSAIDGETTYTVTIIAERVGGNQD